jgi:hypothetical protein
MKRRRLLIPSPLDWQMPPTPVRHPALPVLAEQGGTRLRAQRPVALVDTRLKAGLPMCREGRSNWVTNPLLGSSNSAWSSGKTCPDLIRSFTSERRKCSNVETWLSESRMS